MGPGGDEVGAVGVGEGERCHLLDVGAGREGFVGASQHDGADGGGGGEVRERGVEFGEEGGGERVQGFGAVERY